MDKVHNQPSGRGHHKKKKKGAKLRFDRRKNDECHHHEANKENFFPEHRQDLSDADSTQYSKLEKGPNGEVTKAVSHTDHTWNVHVGGNKVPETCQLLVKFSPSTTSSKVLLNLVKSVDEAHLRPGNPEEQFITICQKRGGEIKGRRGTGDVVAFIGRTPVIDYKGQTYLCTVRRVDCNIICKPEGPYPQRYSPCQSFRSTLQSALSREKDDSHDHTAATSHTRYCHLTPPEKDERMRNLHKACQTESKPLTSEGQHAG